MIDSYLNRVAVTLAATDRGPIIAAVKHLYARWQCRALVAVCGNGGSAATAQHFVCDLTKATRHEQRSPVRAVCLSDNIAALTAWANDTTYSQALAEQLRSVAQPGDVLIAISGSGNSPNVLQAAAYAKAHKMTVVALTGPAGELGERADIAIRVLADDLPTIEDGHMAICHAITNSLRIRIAE